MLLGYLMNDEMEEKTTVADVELSMYRAQILATNPNVYDLIWGKQGRVDEEQLEYVVPESEAELAAMVERFERLTGAKQLDADTEQE